VCLHELEFYFSSVAMSLTCGVCACASCDSTHADFGSSGTIDYAEFVAQMQTNVTNRHF